MRRAERVVFRAVLAAWLFGWYVNAPGFWANFEDALRVPLDWPGFPPLFTDARVALALYAAPFVGALALAWDGLAKPISALLLACAAGALLHVQTGTDATFLTSFWSAAYLVWLAHRRREKGRADRLALATHGRALALAAVGALFLGAALGKRTPGYESGQVFFELYFRSNPSWPYPWLRETLDEAGLRAAARTFSLAALGVELALAAAPLLPARVVLGGTTLAVLTMMSAWTFHLASVLSSVWALALAGWLFDREVARLERRAPVDA